MLRDILKIIIMGFEHSGTTVLLDSLKLSRGLDAGKDKGECGILIPEEGITGFLDFQPYTKRFIDFWGINKNILKDIIENSGTYEEFYKNLVIHSPVILDKKVGIIDKTPGYIYYLPQMILKTEDVPLIIMRKDPKNWASSMMLRGWSYDKCLKWMRIYYYQYNNLIDKEPEKIKLVNYENFIETPLDTIKSICKWADLSYLEEDYHNFIDSVIDCGDRKNFYKKTLSPLQIAEINKDLADFIIV